MARYLTQVLGDANNPNHRALAGNAMEFTGSRWARLTNGTGTIPAWSTNQANTFIIAYRSTANSSGGDSSSIARTIITNASFFNRVGNQLQDGFRIISGGDLYDKFGLDTTTSDFQRSQNSPLLFVANKRQSYIWSDPGGLNTNNKSCLYHGRAIAQTATLQGLTTRTRAAGGPIGIGRYPSQNNDTNSLYPGTNTFAGFIRSIEILVGRTLTNAQLSLVYEFGTAHAAGLTTASDISLDFNGLPGQPFNPCRPGTLQLTFTPYNNTTPDWTGTTFADWNTL